MKNPLVLHFDTLHNTAPFQQIKNEDFLPAFKELIALTEKEIDDLVNNPEEANFKNTFENWFIN
jgi:peptidyl-dipeptidase Dcp